MRLVHDGTVGKALFSVRDDDGDVIQRIEMPFEVRKLNPQGILGALHQLMVEREKLQEQLALQATPALNGVGGITTPDNQPLTTPDNPLQYTPTGEQ